MEKKIRTPIAAIILVVYCLISTLRLTPISNAISLAFSDGNPFGGFADLIFGIFTTSINVWSILSIILSVTLCVALFTRKRNNWLVAPVALSTALDLSLLLYYLYLFFARHVLFYGEILGAATMDMLAGVCTLLLVLCTCEETVFHLSSKKIAKTVKKLWFVPAVFCVISAVISFSRFSFSSKLVFSFLQITLPTMVYAVVLLTLGLWLINPHKEVVKVCESYKNATDTEGEYDGVYCGIGKHILLCLFTCGIWYLIWTYRTTKYLNKAPNAVYYNPTSKLLLCMFVPFYQLYWLYKHGQRIDAMSKQKKLNNSDMSILCLILGIFVPIVAYILMQDRINAICTAKPVEEELKTNNSIAGELVKYKELLDSGVISQSEFDAKKKQLLGL